MKRIIMIVLASVLLLTGSNIVLADGGLVFTDVPADAYYYDAVKWAYEKGIASGTTNTWFSPDDKCNIGQIVTFLWRAAGSPDAKTSPTIADTVACDYYYMAAYWGQSKGMFSRALYPNYSCNRMTAVYYIWCAAGKPECKVKLRFKDFDATKYQQFSESVAWAVNEGITTGTGPDTFGPGKTCTRAQIVTFLHRAASKGLI